MTAYVVTIRPGIPDGRYTDSIWICKDNAERRVEMLIAEFYRRGKVAVKEWCNGDKWGAWVSEIDIEDGSLHPTKEKTQ